MLMAVVASQPGHGNPVAGLESTVMQSHPDPGRVNGIPVKGAAAKRFREN